MMDGASMKTGAVANLRRIKSAAAVARFVLQYTSHSLLVGDQATKFAVENGFVEESLATSDSLRKCEDWKQNRCQPNYRVDVVPDPLTSCGPYKPIQRNSSSLSSSSSPSSSSSLSSFSAKPQQASHDTISMIVVQVDGTMAAGTSTNGASHKIPGRVGDGPIAGSGSYVDEKIGGSSFSFFLFFSLCVSFLAFALEAMERLSKETTALPLAPDRSRFVLFSLSLSFYLFSVFSLFLSFQGVAAPEVCLLLFLFLSVFVFSCLFHRAPFKREMPLPLCFSGSLTLAFVFSLFLSYFLSFTSDGDILMRFLPCYQVVENLRLGMSPNDAAVDALARIARKFPSFGAGIVVATPRGEKGCASYGSYSGGFGYTYAQGGNMSAPVYVPCPAKTLEELRAARPW